MKPIVHKDVLWNFMRGWEKASELRRIDYVAEFSACSGVPVIYLFEYLQEMGHDSDRIQKSLETNKEFYK